MVNYRCRLVVGLSPRHLQPVVEVLLLEMLRRRRRRRKKRSAS
jgi:hypothetical protein